MSLIRSKTRIYHHPWGLRRVKVWKLGPIVLWRKPVGRELAK